MDPIVEAALLRLNRSFYDRFAGEFSASRAVLPPGILRALRSLEGARALLDLGCGDGRIARALATGQVPHRVAHYTGIDFSKELLGRAAAGLPPGIDLRFLEADLSRAGWSARAGLGHEPFDTILCLAALFHIPGRARRAGFLEETRARLANEGRAVVSVWRFLHLPSLREKIVPWEEARIALDTEDRILSPEDVEAGDSLIDWRRGGRGLRYVHHFEEGELEREVTAAGFSIIESYRSDGRTGDLSQFVIAG